jgi:CDP-diacylglycerol--serine O-phosphatidyltransferase
MSGASQPGRGSDNEGPSKEVGRKDGPGKDGPGKDGPGKDGRGEDGRAEGGRGEAGRVSPMRLLHRRLRPRPRPRFKGPSFNRLVPNIMTLIGLCAGLTSMRYALDGRFGAAVVAITVAAGIDGLDGRLARMLKATSRFGAEFDSLADFLCFGVAPAFVLYLWSLQRAGGFGFIPCMMFAVCMALRLARFNAALDSAPGPAYAYNFFTGVPAPAGAGLVLFPLFVGLEARKLGWDWLLTIVTYPLVCAAVLVGVALLLVSTLPVWSFKNFKIPAEYVLPTFLGVGVFVALLVADPWAALAAGGLIYAGMLPFSVRSFRRLRREAEAMREPPDQAQVG